MFVRREKQDESEIECLGKRAFGKNGIVLGATSAIYALKSEVPSHSKMSGK